MTDQPRPLCVVCFRRPALPGQRKCDDCAPAEVFNRKPATATPAGPQPPESGP
jgi:hypothetical protein